MAQTIASFLASLGVVEPQRKRMVRQLIAHRLGKQESFVLAFPEHELPSAIARQLATDVQALADGYPAAYLFGEVPFLEWDFKVDPRALIPRPETESLIAGLIEDYQKRPAPKRIIDLCCGSGCMGLSLALAFPEAEVTLTDLSESALALCAENVTRHHLGDRTRLFQGDLWQAVGSEETFDLIVANPPYVAEDEVVEAGVAANEPHLALYSDDQGSAHMKRILAELQQRLNAPGRAAFELGHQHQKRLEPWLNEHFSDQKWFWRVDTFGVWRFLLYDS